MEHVDIVRVDALFLNQQTYQEIKELLRYLYPAKEYLDYQDYQATLRSSAVIFGACVDDRFVGIAMVTPRRRWYELVWQIDDVVVEPSARGQGIGTLLIGKLLEAARDYGAKFVDVATQDVPALPFYKELGFKERREGGFYATLRYDL